jgi:trans-aconitate 2-methyltransferase
VSIALRDPEQYSRFSNERSRPFFELLERIPRLPFKRIIDLGCGAGELTVSIAERWPDAHVTGTDNSPQMLAKSGSYAIDGHLDFLEQAIEDYDEPADLIFANAALQWVGNHPVHMPRLAKLVNPGGVFAVQMPFSHVQPSHLLLEETARNGPWAEKLAGWQRFQVQDLSWYVELLMDMAFSVDAWETTYYFVLQGEDPILEWVKGTSLQPILNRLDEDERPQFTQQYAARLRQAYPSAPGGTIYPFRRIFFIASRP